MRLARHLEAVVAELRRCTPVLLEAHVRALEGMAQVIVAHANTAEQKEVAP